MLAYHKIFSDLFEEVRKVVVGQDQVVEQVMVSVLSDGNALLEGYPGLAKTLTVKTIAKVMDLRFSRIQHTPDLMPSDITGTYVIEEHDGRREFKFHPGPIFANIVLADEINRASPKTQSALLEAMQEKQVTVGNTTYKLDQPFFVLATMNPIEQEGSLSLEQQVFVNGELKTGKELLELAGASCIREDGKGIRLYDIGGWTFSINTSGKLEKNKCFLYTLPYKDEMVTVTTKTGKKIKVTKNHPFLVNDNGAITWKKAEALTKYDYLVNPARLLSIPSRSVISHEEAVAKMKQKPVPRDIPFDRDFAFWISFLLSDGYIGEKCVQVVQKNYPEAFDRFVAVSRNYGFKPGVSANRGCRYATIYSKPLVEYLNIRFGVKGGKDKEVPSWFLSFPEDMNREFVKTFISLESSLRDNRIVFTQKSANNVNILSYMLLREGILSWIRHDGRIWRMKIQGKDLLNYLNRIGWISDEKANAVDRNREIKSSFRVVPVDRKSLLRLVELLGINSFHTLKGRKDIVSREWYGSYRGIKEGETVMAVDSLRKMVDDIRGEIVDRKAPAFLERLENSPRFFAAGIGVPMMSVVRQLSMPKNQVWSFYKSGHASQSLQIKEHLKEQYKLRIGEAEELLAYFEALLSDYVYYDRVKCIEYEPSQGMAFGLTVPGMQNYIGGFGGCGFNHNTYPLPEAQSDRFLLKIKSDYPSYDEEVEIVNRYAYEASEKKLRTVLTKEHLIDLQQLARQVPIATDLKQEVVKLVTSTRVKKDIIEYGASPRASIGLVLAAKARALVNGRNHVSTEDIVAMSYPVLRHRIILNFEAERKGMTPDDAVKMLVEKIKK